MSYLTEDLLESIKSRSLAPISQSTFDDDKLLKLATEELKLKLTSDLIKVREDFFLTPEQTDIVVGVTRYPIPARAIGSAVKSIWYIENDNKRKLVRTDSDSQESIGDQNGQPTKFVIEGDEIVLNRTPTISATLEFIFPAETNDLALTTTCARITSATPGATTVVFGVDTDLSSELAVGDLIDFLSVKSPFKLWAYQVEIVAISANQIEVATTDITGEMDIVQPSAGDYICPTGTSNIPQVPIAFHPVLAQMVVVRLMESLGDLNKMNAAKATLIEMRDEAKALVKNRVETSVQKASTKSQLVRFFR